MPETTPNEANSTIYNRWVMRWIYRIWVHWISHRLAWRVSDRWLRKAYQSWTGPTHLSIGPGNGDYLRDVAEHTHTVHLLDLNPACLEMGAEAVRNQEKRAIVHPPQDVLLPWKELEDESVDSVDATMVLHCVRGAELIEKAEAFTEAYRVLRPGGRFFGATILSGGEGVRTNAFARMLLRVYNTRTNTFSNTGDTTEGLQQVLLQAGFTAPNVQVQGTTGVWTAVKS